MKVTKLSFITPTKTLTDKIVLEKKYAITYNIPTGTSISLASDIGNTNKQQDSVAIIQNNEYLLLLVSDGMGGIENGEIASYNTAKIIKKWFESEDEETLKILNEQNLEAVLNALMYLISTNIPINSGATLNMSIICPEITLIVNIGDSRTYTIKDGKINIRTKDESVAFERFNPTTREERDNLRFLKSNNIITNAIAKDIFPTITISSIKNEDYDIICHVTDGVTDFLSESIIESFCQLENPAVHLVSHATSSIPIYRRSDTPQFNEYLYPGQDNATAIVYTKKRIKNN